MDNGKYDSKSEDVSARALMDIPIEKEEFRCYLLR